MIPGVRSASGYQRGDRTEILIAAPEQAALIAAARDSAPVSALTHNFYRYPARFSPRFVRAAIEIFSAPGDVVLDPFMGGGTTLVEALALGRHGIGVDISSLAAFVAGVKTTLLDDEEFEALERWAKWAPRRIHMQRFAVHFADYADAGYYRHLTSPATWRLRKAIEQALASVMKLYSARLEAFARCVVLRTAQWALDGRRVLPKISEFREALLENATQMIAGARELRAAVAKQPKPVPIRLLQKSAAELGAAIEL